MVNRWPALPKHLLQTRPPGSARQLYAESQAAGRKLTGAELGRALGTSDSYGRLLLREFRASRTTTENGASKEACCR